MVEHIKDEGFYVGEFEDKVFIKLVGNTTMRNSKTLSDFMDKVLAGEVKDIILDMENCNYMDSTMLGLLAKTAIIAKKKWKKTIFMINVPNMILAGIKSTGVNKLYEVVESMDFDKFTEMKSLEETKFTEKSDKTKHILEAHKTLMDLSDENRDVFKNVVNLLERELEN